MQTRKQFRSVPLLRWHPGAAFGGLQNACSPEAPLYPIGPAGNSGHPGKLFAHGGNEFGENFLWSPDRLGDMNAAHLKWRRIFALGG